MSLLFQNHNVMRLRYLILSIIATFVAANSSAANRADAPSIHPDSLVQYARQYIGTPYGYGQSSGKRFDCSGFTSYVFGHYGCKLARSSHDQYLEGDSVDRGSWVVGDLVFFSGRSGGQTQVGHVGIVVSVDEQRGDFEFIHASSSRGVIISRSTERYYAARYIGARRMLTPFGVPNIEPSERPLTTHEKIFGRLEFHPIPDLIQPHQFPIEKPRKRRRK